jgi:intein-encoded DNA endonuclease-like protein
MSYCDFKATTKAEIVIKLAEEGKNTTEIAKVAHISPKDIGIIIRRHLGEEENETEYLNKALSMNSKAFRLFKEGTNQLMSQLP